MKALACASLLLCSGCALLVGKADYADYREIRLASDLQTRALAMQRYVARHPSGHWREEIQAARASQDLAAFEAGKDTRQGLEHYLSAYPDGAFVAQARGRLSAVAMIEQRNQAAQRQQQILADARKQRLEELRRTWIGRFIGYWTNTLSGIRAWGEPIANVAEANPQFSRAFAAQPRPRCTEQECLKYYTSQFAIPVPGGNRLERTLSLVLRLRMRAGKLERAELLLPERGFSRWYELENRKPVVEGDPQARATAAEWAMQRLQPLLAALGGELAPLQDARPPTIERPAIGPSGELTDTSIEAPSDPQNRVAGEADNAGIGTDANAAAAPSVAELVKPNEQPASDMVFTPMAINKQGQRLAPVTPIAPQPPAAAGGAPAPASGDVMVMDPVAVPKQDRAPAPAEAPAAAPHAAAVTDPAASAPDPVARAGLVRGFQLTYPAGDQNSRPPHGLRIVAFAAGLDGNSTYDGLVIEPSAAARAPGKAKPAPSKPPPRAH